MSNQAAVIALVVPCYNESAILEQSARTLSAKLDEMAASGQVDASSMILMADDGSTDDTWEIISRLHAERPDRFYGIRLAANRGHQAALLAALMESRKFAEAAISLDADLQDDIDVLPQFVAEYRSGHDIVYGVRSDRSSDTFLKRTTAQGFYRLLGWMGVKTIYNHADFRLMSRRALDALSEYREVNLYLRGLVPLIGFRQAIVTYSRKPASRPTHYPLAKMLLLAWDGITSFSVRPIRIITLAGLVALLVCVAMLLYVLHSKFFGYTVAGWTSLTVVVLLFSGIQLVSIGVIGEYIAKTYMEVKHRPRYLVSERLEPHSGDHDE
ncbi:MAG: glycosyltransferase family 2 protein [Lentisphaeria bacterium]|nr:glycosyltransferase family 2 protein [Lentisphaeria bacterium]